MVLIQNLLVSRTITVLKLQQLTGHLNFLENAIFPGRTFTRRLYARYAKLDLKQHYHIKVDKEMKADCHVWLDFLQNPTSVCRPIVDFTDTLEADLINFATDASGGNDKGFGCVFNSDCTYGLWEDLFVVAQKPSIKLLELYAVAVAIELCACRLENRRVVISCDYQAGMDQQSIFTMFRQYETHQNDYTYEFETQCQVLCKIYQDSR